MRKAVHFFPVVMLAGCASMSADNCAVGDWSAAGYADGVGGEPFSVIAERPEKCAQYAASDIDAYLAGMTEGLAAYCDPATGFAAGASGRAYYGVCAGPEGEVFETAFAMGRRAFTLRQASASPATTIGEARADLWEVKQREAMVEIALRSSASRADRIEYRSGLKFLAAERARLEAEIASPANAFAEADDALTAYRPRASGDTPEGGVLRPIQAAY